MPDVLLSAPLIVRNEERFLEACLRSLADLVDEVVVVDTGSTDRTREIALDLGARLHEFPWVDDFARARNHALGLARGSWILYIDADERLRPCAVGEVRARLAEPGFVAHQLLLHPRPAFTPYWELRLFRSDPTIRFRGVIHESIWPAVRAYQARHGGAIGRVDLVLDHEGYEGDQDHKHARNLPLLRRALRRDPTRVFAWCHVASIHLARRRPRLAERAWERALAVVRGKRGQQPEDSLPYAGLIQWRLGRGDDVTDLLAEATERFPGNLQIAWLRARAHMAAKRYAEAIPVLERLVERGRTGDFDRSAAYDARLFGVFAWEALATCHFQLARYADSGRYFALAAQRDPGQLEYRVKQALCARLAARP